MVVQKAKIWNKWVMVIHENWEVLLLASKNNLYYWKYDQTPRRTRQSSDHGRLKARI